MTAGAGSGVAAGRGADRLRGRRGGPGQTSRRETRVATGGRVGGRGKGQRSRSHTLLRARPRPAAPERPQEPGTRACPRESRGGSGGGHSRVSGQRLTSDPVAKPAAPQFPGASQPLPLTSGFWAPSWRRRALPLLRGGAAFGAGLRGAGAGLGCCRDWDPFTVLRPQGSNLTPLDSLGLSFPLPGPAHSQPRTPPASYTRAISSYLRTI